MSIGVIVGYTAAAVLPVANGKLTIWSHANRTTCWSWRESRRLPVFTVFSAVKFMGVFELGKLMRFGRQRVCSEVRMFEGVDSIDAFAPVQLKKFREEGDGQGIGVSKSFCNVIWSVGKLMAVLNSRQFAPPWHALIGGRSNKIEDKLRLV